MIIVSIVGPSMQEALAQVAGSLPYADLFEFRLDLMTRPNIANLISSARKPTIVTCRPAWEGGGFSGSERERIGMLDFASVFGAHYVDIELNSSASIVADFIRRQKETKVIVSHHLLDGELFDVRQIYKALHATGADVIKLAYEATDSYENHMAFDFLELAKHDKRKGIAITLGDVGEPSRILYRKFGGWATYAATEDGKSAATGQIAASELKELYRADRLTPGTKVFGVVGNPVNLSKGIFVHNQLFHRANSNAVYCRFKVVNIDRFMRWMSPHLQGFSVTLPHKQSVMGYLDKVDTFGKAIGAVNTIVRRGNKLVGTNTDATGALDAIEQVARVKGKRVLILGAGGAARAIVYEAKRRGAEVIVTNRTATAGQQLAREIACELVKWSSRTGVEFDVLVNATPVGMAPHTDESPFPKKFLKGKIVFDVVYNPPMTRLLKEARSVGARIVPGTVMYLNQAALQCEMYTGRKPDMNIMRKLLQIDR